jgi:ketosteroid isomerase-like protein
MASANVNLVRSIFADWERGDFSSAEWAHPEIEWAVADGPSPGSWTGTARAWEGWRSRMSPWEDLRIEAEEYRVLEDDRVLVLTRASGRGKRSGVELGHTYARGAGLFELRDGRVSRCVAYFDRERAFADLGLAPDPNVSSA